MRTAFAHEAEVSMTPDADPAEVGAAITTAVCGHWEHDPPCPLAPHHTRAEAQGAIVRIRTLFACAPVDEQEVRDRIDAALQRGSLGDESPPSWQLLSSGPSTVEAAEAEHAERLVES
jgi:hypothetical protein